MAKKSLLKEVLTGPKYTKEDFIIPVSDSKGHSSPLGLRCRSRYIRTMHEVLAAGVFPYKTVSDILRHAIHRHLEWLKEIEPDIPISMTYLDAAVDIARVQQMHLDFLNTIQSVSTTVNQLVEVGMEGEAKKMVRSLIDRMEADPLEDAWRKKFTKELKERFGHLLPELK